MQHFKKIIILSIFFTAVIFLFLSTSRFSTRLSTDETVLFFTVDAHQKILNGQPTWLAPLHAWVYEEEKDSVWRGKLVSQIAGEIELDNSTAEYQNLQDNLMMFLVDSQSFKTLSLSIEKQLFSFGRSGHNGHIKKTVEFKSHNNDALIAVNINEPVLPVTLRKQNSVIRLIPAQGVSIISDIDDTIKDSHVLDKKELIRNTFLKPAKPVKSMNVWYQCMLEHFSNEKKSLTYFHYISASPWQLYPMLDSFLEQYKFPVGSLYLRQFRLKDQSFLNFLKPSTDYKIATISELIERFPARDFILIGDSGEHDPEIYARIFRQFPQQVKKIYIRKVPESDLSSERFQQTFASIATDKWELFDEKQLSSIKGFNTLNNCSKVLSQQVHLLK